MPQQRGGVGELHAADLARVHLGARVRVHVRVQARRLRARNNNNNNQLHLSVLYPTIHINMMFVESRVACELFFIWEAAAGS